MNLVVAPQGRFMWLSKPRNVCAVRHPMRVIQGRQVGQKPVKMLSAAGIGLTPKPATDDDVHRYPYLQRKQGRGRALGLPLRCDRCGSGPLYGAAETLTQIDFGFPA